MKYPIPCKKCLVVVMCHQKCDSIRSFLHVLSIISHTSMVTVVLSWAIGFGLKLSGMEDNIIMLIFIVILVLSMGALFTSSKMRSSIQSRFNSGDHISRYC